MDGFRIEHGGNLLVSPAYPLFLHGYAELLEHGFAEPGIPWSKDTQVTYVSAYQEDTQTVLGCLAWNYNKVQTRAWVLLSYVRADCRGKNMYKEMNAVAEDRMRLLGATEVQALVHADNTTMLKASIATGKTVVYHRTRKTLDPL